jgi:pyruvate dehydrogenase E2 component (dihydrolipoamide acetyltransferase)
MPRYEFKLPDIGEGVTEGEIVTWLIEPGQTIAEDEPMVEVMTDKATVTIAAPRSGRIVETRGRVGEVVKVHSVLVVFDLEETAKGRLEVEPNGGGNGTTKHDDARHAGGGSAVDAGNVASAVGDIREDLPGMHLASPSRLAASSAVGDGYFNEKPLATPATRKLARDLGLDLRTIRPSGSFGRVTSDDVRVAVSSPAHAPAEPAERPAPRIVERPAEASQAPRARAVAPVPAPGVSSLEERAPLKGLRRRIFENMSRSHQEVAQFTFVEECDVTQLKELRARLKEAAGSEGVNLTYLPFIIKAVVLALRRHPALNATFDVETQEVVSRRYYNIGVATATEAGLVVPVVKNADDRSLLDIARELERLAEGARSQKLKLDDLQGGTFTVTSLGQQGGLFATPIVHHPEVAILGVHQMKRKPVVRGDQIVIGDVMLLSLSFDHRLIDGHVGAAFAYELIDLLEHPETMFLDMV